MLHEQPDRALSRAPDRTNAAVPLFVDVDGTLTRAAISLASFVLIGRSSIAALIAVLACLVEDRVLAMAMAARRARKIGTASSRARGWPELWYWGGPVNYKQKIN